MTIIAAKKYEDRIEMASDSRATAGDFIWNDDIQKIYRNDRVCIAAAGNSDIVYTFFRKIIKENILQSAYIENMMVYSEYLDDFLTEYDISMLADSISLVTILGNDQSLLCRSMDRECTLIKEFSAIGIGYPIAMGALEMGATPVEAVKIACKYNSNCGGKIQNEILCIEDKQKCGIK